MESVRQDVERASRLRFANEENKRAELGATLGSVGTMAHLGATQHWANSRDIYKSLMPKTPCTPRQATGQPRRLLPEYTLTPAQRSIQLNDSFRKRPPNAPRLLIGGEFIQTPCSWTGEFLSSDGHNF